MKLSQEVSDFANEYINFMNKSKSPWHVVDSIRDDLVRNGFTELSFENEWSLQSKGKYFLQKGGSTVIAFALGGKWSPSSPIALCAPHSDSPSLRVKPISKRGNLGYLEVGAAQYGGGLWHTWFDKDLGLSGRVFIKNQSKIESRLVHIKKPIAKIPSLAIHFDSSMNTAFKFNHETELLPILGLSENASKIENDEKHHSILMQLLASEIGCKTEDIIEFDLNLIDVESACFGGINNEFIFGQNQDNQICSFACNKALIAAVQQPDFNDVSHVLMCATYDHEEIGNRSDSGASSDFTVQVIKSITGPMNYNQCIEKSFALSADVDHAINPNYESFYEVQSRPTLDGGPSIKYNPRMEFATTGLSAAIARIIADMAEIPVQSSIPINGNRTGSTHGPSLSSLLGITTVDIGPPILAMHSIRETSGVEGLWQMFKYTETFFLKYGEILRSMAFKNKMNLEADGKQDASRQAKAKRYY